MTKEEIKRARQLAKERVLRETVIFHARAIEKILGREMPKGWSMRICMEVLDEQKKSFCSCKVSSIQGVTNIGYAASDILDELLDKDNLNYHIQNAQKS